MRRFPVFRRFDVNAASAVLLVLAAVTALVMANSPWAAQYVAVVQYKLRLGFGAWSETRSVLSWTKDGLMSVFFLVVGLEIKHEILKGTLAGPGKLALPIAAAFGGMAGPALVYCLINRTGGDLRGWPIPTATDIAFALAALAIFGRGLPASLRTFLLTLAIVDDLGAVILIAVLFTKAPAFSSLIPVFGVLAGMVALGRWRSAPIGAYLLGFIGLWGLTVAAGVNTSLAGIATAALVPATAIRPGATAPLNSLLSRLQPWVAFGILPIFAFVAAGVAFGGFAAVSGFGPITLGVGLGLLIGKPFGVLAMTWAMTATNRGRLPHGATALELIAVSVLCGIGFTMSLFLGGLAFPDHATDGFAHVQIGVLGGSAASLALGGLLLTLARHRRLSGMTP